MSASHGPYHRIGKPGGPGCPVTALPITLKGLSGEPIPAELLDAGTEVTEVELLRTIAAAKGIRWGRDDLGWWAAVPKSPGSKKPWWRFW